MINAIKILVVDDESVGRNLLEAILLPEGYKVVFGTNGEEALEAIRQHKPDIILCDVMMPVLDGFGVARELRENNETAHIPLLLITALDDRDSLIRGIEAGADDYISKPFSRLEILAKVKNQYNLLQHRLGNTSTQEKQNDTTPRKLANAIIQVFDDNFAILADSKKSELLRIGSSGGDVSICSKIQIDTFSFYLHISGKGSDKNLISTNILIQKCFEKNATSGINSPSKLISMVFDDLKKLSSQFGMHEIEKSSIAIAVVSVNEAEGTCVASGINQQIFAEGKLSSSSVTSSKELQVYKLKPEEDLQFLDWNYSFVLSASAYTSMQGNAVLNRINEQRQADSNRDIESIFSDIFDQTQDLLLLKLSI